MLPASKPSYSTANSGYASGNMGKRHAEAHVPIVSLSASSQRSPNRKVLAIVQPSPRELCSAGMSMHMSLPSKWPCLPLAMEMHTMQPCIEGLNRTQVVRVPIGEYVPRPRHIPRIIKQTGVQCPIAVFDRKTWGSSGPSNRSQRSRVQGAWTATFTPRQWSRTCLRCRWLKRWANHRLFVQCRPTNWTRAGPTAAYPPAAPAPYFDPKGASSLGSPPGELGKAGVFYKEQGAGNSGYTSGYATGDMRTRAVTPVTAVTRVTARRLRKR